MQDFSRLLLELLMKTIPLQMNNKTFLYSSTAMIQHFKVRKKVDLPMEKAEAVTKLLFEVLKVQQIDFIITRNCLASICELAQGLDWCIDDQSSLQLLLTLIQIHSNEQKKLNIRLSCLKLIRFFAKKDGKVKEFMGSCGAVETVLQIVQAKRNQCKSIKLV